MPLDNIRILGSRLDVVNWEIVEKLCEEYLQTDKAHHIVTLNGEIALQARGTQLQTVINQADLVIPDSTNVVMAAKLHGKKLSRTQGSELVVRLANIASGMGKSMYLLGAKEGIAAKAAQKLQKLFPDLKIAGTSSANPTDHSISEHIKATGADIVLVAYGAPKQELWISEHKWQTGAKILVGVGGTFDMLAGTLPRAPKFIQAIGLEWLWRLILQPKRIGRIWKALVIFPLAFVFTNKTS